MKVFVLRRGESQPFGPLTAAEVAEMRIHWEVSDADYFRTEDSDRWHLVGELVPAAASRPRFSPALRWMAAAVVAVTAFMSFLATRPVITSPAETSLVAHAPDNLPGVTEEPSHASIAPQDQGSLENSPPAEDSPQDASA